MQRVDGLFFERAKKGDRKAKDFIVEANTGLVWACVKRYRGLLEQEELFQLGVLGLLKSLDRFDPNLGYTFSTFAVPYITGEIKRYLRDDTLLKIGRKHKEIALKAKVYADSYFLRTGEEPSLKKTADAMGISVDSLLEAKDATAPVRYIEDLGEGSLLAPQTQKESKDNLALKGALDNLDEPFKSIVLRRFFKEETQKEIAQSLRISQAQVSRLEKKALLLLRSFLGGKRRIYG